MAPGTPAAEIPLSGDDERQLIEAAQADPRRFAELYERNFDRVYAFIARRTGDRAVAEDLTSEVFHHALAHLGRFEWRGVPFAAWLLRIARNAVADRWERMAREHGAPTPASEDDGSRDDDLGNRPHASRGLGMSAPGSKIKHIVIMVEKTMGAVKAYLTLRAVTAAKQMASAHAMRRMRAKVSAGRPPSCHANTAANKRNTEKKSPNALKKSQ